MSKPQNLSNFLDELIEEVSRDLDEDTATGDISGYETPHAFAGDSDKKRKKTSTQAGYEIVNESVNVKTIKQVLVGIDKQFPKYKSSDKNKVNVLLTKNLGKLSPFILKTITGYYDQYRSGDENINTVSGDIYSIIKPHLKETKVPVKRTNRWLELKNDDTMHANKKLSIGLRELRNQLHEVERFLGWYNKIKNINELDSDTYWKRTNNNIRRIKERIINIARTLKEIEQ